IHTKIDSRAECCALAITAATAAMIPTATIPHPETAVNEPAASIASRMKARLSIARTCSAGGSGAGARCKGVTDAMGAKVGGWFNDCQVLCSAKLRPFRPLQIHLLTQSDRARQRVARRKALLYHLVQP